MERRTAASRCSLALVLRRVGRLRDTTLPWVLLLGIVIAWTPVDAPDPHADETSWALEKDGRLGFK